MTDWRLGSQVVHWWEFHQWATPYLQTVDGWPTIGTHPWFDLDDTDPRKWAAVIDAAQHHALRIEIAQDARREASHDIAAAFDWAAIGNRIRRHRQWLKQHPWAKRRPA